MNKFQDILLIDPIYSEKGYPIFDNSHIVSSSTPLPAALNTIEDWLNNPGVLVLENVINYFDKDTVSRLLLNKNFSHLIIGNNSIASFGDKHPERLRNPDEIQSVLKDNKFNLISDSFVSDNTLVGVYMR